MIIRYLDGFYLLHEVGGECLTSLRDPSLKVRTVGGLIIRTEFWGPLYCN